MTPDPSDQNSSTAVNPARAMGNVRHRDRVRDPSERKVRTSNSGKSELGKAPIEKRSPITAETVTRFLIVDNRYGTPIHVFLELDPSTEPAFPGFGIQVVILESPTGPVGLGVPAGLAIGRNPHQLNRFRAFRSDRSVADAGFILIEPRYVGPSWPAYVLVFRPSGDKPGKSTGAVHHAVTGKR
jgi:hypothetical protein